MTGENATDSKGRQTRGGDAVQTGLAATFVRKGIATVNARAPGSGTSGSGTGECRVAD